MRKIQTAERDIPPEPRQPRPQAGKQRKHAQSQERKTLRVSDNHRREDFLSEFAGRSHRHIAT